MIQRSIRIVMSAGSCACDIGQARLHAMERARRGALLPVSAYTSSWSLQMLDVAFLIYSAKENARADRELWTYWTADSSPIAGRNWMNSGYWKAL